MKRALGIGLCFFALGLVNAGEPVKIEAFATFPFGSTTEQAKAVLDDHGAVFQKKESTPTRLRFSNGTFGFDDAEQWDLYFVDGKFFKGVVAIGNPSPLRLKRYRRIKRELTHKYGPPLKGQPNEKDESTMDESELYQMIANGKASVQERWKIGDGSILYKMSKLNGSVCLTVTYQDDTLTALAEKEQKSDF